ncbi:hypothetical protein A0J61_11028 [Choanephora cucurbitarum]|uniref:Retrotransposon gag domain-containing protein n=1 Tax=Choanephora cucurbitarum TaxID=101091 RepID=A0A1C7MVT5_9FUNG|nr:hypothetical protein A0J61_11028 [Choanephora cucurbitarum]
MSTSTNHSLVNYSSSPESTDNQLPSLLPLTEDITADNNTECSADSESKDTVMTETWINHREHKSQCSSIESTIMQLRDQVESLTIASVTATDKEQFQKNHQELKTVKAKLKYALDSQKLIKPSRDSIILPSGLPLFQWRGGLIQNDNQIVFENVNDVLNKFVTIVGSYGMNVNWHFKRLLPTCLNTRMNAWLSDFLHNHKNAKWSDVQNALIEKYGISNDKMQQSATNKLMNVKMYKNEDIDDFSDRFNVLQSEARVFEEHMLYQFFLSALPAPLSHQLSMFNATASNKKPNKIKFLMKDAQRLYNCIESLQWENKKNDKKRSFNDDYSSNYKKIKL